MKKQPFPFQKLAVSWAIEEKGKHKIKGGLLADLMGLGKTIEGMTTALRLKNEGKINNCLIICPATLKTQWQQEIESFSHESSDRKSTRLNSSHVAISYAVFCLKKKKKKEN